MTEQIIPRATWRAKGARAADAGHPIESHDLNPGSPAILDFKLGWIVRQAEKAGLIAVDELTGEVSP